MILDTCFAAALLGVMLWPGAPSQYAKPELLIDPQAMQLGEFVVLDARTPDEYAAGHIPGARWVDSADWAKGFDQGQDLEGWKQRIGNLGLERGSKVVIYDDNRTKDAARMWWILRYWGFEDVRLLNGGWKGWRTTKRDVETEFPAQPAVTKPDLRPVTARLATKGRLLSALKGNDLQIIDSRSEAEFCGDDALKNKRAGAIPGAIHLEWDDLLDAETGRFLEAAEMAKLFADAGIDLSRPSATHCQSGGRASVMAFGMELMGAEDVSNYYRSWQEWGNADDTPVVKGSKSGQE